jgi:hypothetical protein
MTDRTILSCYESISATGLCLIIKLSTYASAEELRSLGLVTRGIHLVGELGFDWRSARFGVARLMIYIAGFLLRVGCLLSRIFKLSSTEILGRDELVTIESSKRFIKISIFQAGYLQQNRRDNTAITFKLSYFPSSSARLLSDPQDWLDFVPCDRSDPLLVVETHHTLSGCL